MRQRCSIRYHDRWATYDYLNIRDVTATEKADPTFSSLPRYWIPKSRVKRELFGRWDYDWMISFRKICRSTDERTLISCVTPTGGFGDSCNVLLVGSDKLALLIGNLSSLVVDYVLRQKLGGTNLTLFQFQQLAVLRPSLAESPTPWQPEISLSAWITPYIVELLYTSCDMRAFANTVNDEGPPFRWDSERRFLLRAELDAAFFHLYGLKHKDVDHVLDNFRILRNKDQVKYGADRSKCAILEIFDGMEKAISQDSSYNSVLEPKPGEGERHLSHGV